MRAVGVRVPALCAACWLAAAVAHAATFQFEVLGASGDWVVIRENLPASATDTDACRYPGLEPSDHVGVTVHFVRLSPEAKRGRLLPLATPDSSVMVYERRRTGGSCTSAAEAEQRWREIAGRAKSLEIELSAKAPVPMVLGTSVPAKSCVLIGGTATAAPPCRQVFRQRLHGAPIQIAVSLTAVPEAPGERVCQFVGHRLVAVLQVAGFDFGAIGSVAPGGVAEHYDCRSQRFEPLRLYDLGHVALVIGGFAGTNIANRTEQPFLVAFPTRPAP